MLVVGEGSAEAPVLARNLAAGGFHGRLMAVGASPDGFEAFPDIAALPVTPDLAVEEDESDSDRGHFGACDTDHFEQGCAT